MNITPNYGLGQPEATDEFKDFRQLFNDNMKIIDNGLGNKNIADEYDDTSTYNVDEYVIYEGVLYKCTTAVTVAEPFDNTKWTAVLVTDEMGGGGGGGSYTAGDGIDITSNTISVDTVFTEASTRTNINSGDTFSTILGKIKKWFTDLPSMFVSKSGDTMTGSLTLGDTSRGELYIKGNDPTYSTRFYNSSAEELTADRSISLPDKSGTLAVTSDLTNYVAKSGDTMTGALKISNGYGIQLENGAVSTVLYQQSAPVAVVNTIQMPNASGVLALRSDISNAYVDCPRVNSANLNNLPQQNKTVFTEVNPDSTNLPDAFWYHVITIQGSDTGYATQTAIGMTTSKVWYRRKDGGSWQAWTRII